MTLAPQLKSMIKQARSSGYTFDRALYEFIDNSIDAKSTIISIKIIKDSEKNIPCSIMISDNSTKGVKDLKSIFEWGLNRNDRDNELSEFGFGFKSASVNLCNNIKCYTNYKNQYNIADANWRMMSESNTYTPDISSTNYEGYKKYHKISDNGTTFILTDLNKDFIPIMDYFQFELKMQLNRCYCYDIKKKNLEIRLVVNNKTEILNKNTYEILFDRIVNKVNTNYKTSWLHIYYNTTTDNDVYIIEYDNNNAYLLKDFQRYKNGRLKCNDKENVNITGIEKTGKYINKRTIEFISGLFITTDRSLINKEEDKFCGKVDIYLLNRMVGIGLSFLEPRYDGYSNYIRHEIHITDKKLIRTFGITYNKCTDNNLQNKELYSALSYLQNIHESQRFPGDSSFKSETKKCHDYMLKKPRRDMEKTSDDIINNIYREYIKNIPSILYKLEENNRFNLINNEKEMILLK